MKGQATVKGVGKYKPKFDQTGFLLDAGAGEFWANIPGQRDYQQYKGKSFEFNLEQDAKGYWSGVIVNDPAPQGASSGSSAAPQGQAGVFGGQQSQTAPPQSPAGAIASPSVAKRDYDRENHGKCFTLVLGEAMRLLQSGMTVKDLEILLLEVYKNDKVLRHIADLATVCMKSYNYRTPNRPGPEEIPYSGPGSTNVEDKPVPNPPVETGLEF